MTEPLSYTLQTASDATGLSVDIIRRAVNAGNLTATRPTVTDRKTGEARKIAKSVILRAELERWLTGAAA